MKKKFTHDSFAAPYPIDQASGRKPYHTPGKDISRLRERNHKYHSSLGEAGLIEEMCVKQSVIIQWGLSAESPYEKPVHRRNT